MPCVAATTTILPTGLPDTQGYAALAFVHTQLLAAGFRFVRVYTYTGASAVRLYRYPKADPHDTRAEMLCLWSASGALLIENLYDVNVNDAPIDPPGASVIWASGAVTGGAWPTTGSPSLGDLFNDGVFALVTFDGISTYTFRVIVSECGVVMARASGGASFQVAAHDRFLDEARIGREMAVRGCLSTGSYPVTFAAPTGGPAVHLRFIVEGVTVNVTFPAATLSAFEIAQQITRQGEGFIEAYVRPRVGETDEVVVRIPPSRPPVGNYSTTRPQLALSYQDPTVTAANLRFHIGTSSGWTVVAGSPGSIQKTGFNAVSNNVREGAHVYNHTQSAGTTVVSATTATPFSTTSTQDDTLALLNTTGWSSSDVIEVYPGPETQLHGRGRHGGLYQCVLSGAECSDIEDGADRTVVLSDIYGEAQSQFEVGQTLLVANNGFCVTLALSGVVGSFVHGEEVVTNVGTRGYVRGIDGTDISVDVTETAAGGVPFTLGDTLTGQRSGATATLTPEAATTSRTGWSGLFRVLAKGQVDAANGDYRTTLTLDMDDVTVNPNFVVGPGAVIGSHAKFSATWNSTSEVATNFVFMPNLTGSFTVFNLQGDVNRNEDLLVTEPAHEPDWETHALQLAEFMARLQPATGLGTDLLGTFAHIRGVNARNDTVVQGDLIAEDGDTVRSWVSVMYVSLGAGAASNAYPYQWLCIGPGGVV